MGELGGLFLAFAKKDWFRFLGGGFKHVLFSPLLGEMIQFHYYFSHGLKPPTSLYRFVVVFCYTCFFWVKTKSKKKLTNFWMMKIHWYLAWDTFPPFGNWGAVSNPCVEKIRCFNQEIFQACCWNKGICCCSLKKNSSFCALVPWFLCAWIEAWHFSGMDWQNENMMWKYTGGIWKNHLGWNVANFYSRHVPKIPTSRERSLPVFFYCINIRESQKPLK